MEQILRWEDHRSKSQRINVSVEEMNNESIIHLATAQSLPFSTWTILGIFFIADSFFITFFFLSCATQSTRQEIQLRVCFDFVGHCPGKKNALCSETKCVLDLEHLTPFAKIHLIAAVTPFEVIKMCRFSPRNEVQNVLKEIKQG